MREKLRTRWEQSKWKARIDRLPRLWRLSRGKTLALNLLIIAVAGAWLWGLAGYPLPTAELEFRRLERQCLVPRSELVFAATAPERYEYVASPNDKTVTALDGTEISMNNWQFVGVTERLAVVAEVAQRGLGGYGTGLEHYVRDGTPLLLPLGGDQWSPLRGYWVTEEQKPGEVNYTYHGMTPLVLLDVPEEARRAEVSLELHTWEELLPYEAVCWDMGGGVWLVGAFREDEARPDRFAGGTYTLRLYDGAGALLLEREGAVPQPL
ncbi:hypothetical protein DWX58_04960 [Pseudoflavonifractor sp. AF19-9AC]|uniref:hypothetical protein n=1 Tax=Pseudoflavonifractor sp. AF19-9AC TaxID=2292244 RepID=UPI000E491513|nr:hypothetical protein [Pseudoflavonifractor sp. AF19-9AC]RHR10735.1 hypothetical protein DWX58_04960 [Pseudoflavonifractor sp. AF19-9AC]